MKHQVDTNTVFISYAEKKGHAMLCNEGRESSYTSSTNFEISENNAFLPGSSKILSSVRSCKATREVSNMSRPALLANVNTGTS